MPSAFGDRRFPIFPVAGLAMVILAVLAAIWLIRAQDEASALVRHTIEVELSVTRAVERVRAIESAHRGYLIAGNAEYVADLERARTGVQSDLDDLRQLISDNPVQRANLDRLTPLVRQKIAFADSGVAAMQGQDRQAALTMIETGRGKQLMTAVREAVDAMLKEEERLLAIRVAETRWLVGAVGVGLAAALVLVIAVAYVTVKDAQGRFVELERARDEARLAAIATQAEMDGREKAEAQLRQMQKMESIGQLTGGIAHDFNNMLAIIIGSLDMAMRRRNDAEKVDRCLANARDGAERAAALTARLLAFSRQSPLAPVALDPNRLVAGMSELLRRTLGEAISVETVLAGGLWRTFADPGMLENALLNLAVNARDAMPEGGRLTIETANAHLDDDYARAHQDVIPGQYALISVTDSGQGMSADTIERAFDPFFTTKAIGKGTGLGLSQVFGFVKQSGGHVSIYSEPGRGTTLKLYLPRFSGPLPEDRIAGSDDMALPEGRADEIILVVEDEQRVRHFSVDALRELGYTAISAGSGAEALILLREQPSIALLFTDVVMPEMDGRRLADAALHERPGLRVLYTTGYTRNAVVHNGMLDAGVAFLPKPFTIAQLARKVREVLDGRGANRPN
ncbi:CHASE3 domain-containing protein [Sphingomonas sp. 1P06PA]|uniref:CHASE3 domain-containing protein n=1 Tax=Sphingomonas sp. 1P06PA TaxID=554121 RepID=UPI0039A7323B